MDTKSLIVTEATNLFYEKGYVSVGITEIIALTNTSKGSFYHHFPKGKEQLLITCLEKVQQDVIEAMEQHFVKHLTFKEAIISIFAELINMYEEQGKIVGYTFTSMVSEISVVSDEVREKCGNLYTQIEDVISMQLQKRGVPLEDAKQKALLLTSLIEGSILLSIMKKSSEPMRINALQIGQYIEI
ncbi:MAG TPA: TetR/AcrR family transcriptional regulator [Ureibacillus sp.]|nr:TetR/AcrR family transcriptional regulator [Ureibacillus sp.]